MSSIDGGGFKERLDTPSPVKLSRAIFFVLLFGSLQLSPADVWDATSLDVHGENVRSAALGILLR